MKIKCRQVLVSTKTLNVFIPLIDVSKLRVVGKDCDEVEAFKSYIFIN